MCVFWEGHIWYDTDVIVCVYFGRDTYGMILMLSVYVFWEVHIWYDTDVEYVCILGGTHMV